jgi:hypothetical protein
MTTVSRFLNRSETHPQIGPLKMLRKPRRDQIRPMVKAGRCPARIAWAPKKVMNMGRDKPEVK